MRLLKLASARPVARTHALPQPFVPGTDPLVTPLKGTRAGLRVKRSRAASQLTKTSPPKLCWALLLPLELYCPSSSTTPSSALSRLGLYRPSGPAITSWALSPLGPYRASWHLSGTFAPGLCRRLFGSIASWALLPLGSFYHLLGYIAPRALLSPLGLYRVSPLGLGYRLSGFAASRAPLLPFWALSSRALPSH